MLAGADSIEDMDLLRHGAMGRVFTPGRAPSTLGTFEALAAAIRIVVRGIGGGAGPGSADR